MGKARFLQSKDLWGFCKNFDRGIQIFSYAKQSKPHFLQNWVIRINKTLFCNGPTPYLPYPCLTKLCFVPLTNRRARAPCPCFAPCHYPLPLQIFDLMPLALQSSALYARAPLLRGK